MMVWMRINARGSGGRGGRGEVVHKKAAARGEGGKGRSRLQQQRRWRLQGVVQDVVLCRRQCTRVTTCIFPATNLPHPTLLLAPQVTEKENGMRSAMSVMGMMDSAYW